MDWQQIVPGAPEVAGADLSLAREVRLRPGQPVEARLPQGEWRGTTILGPGEITQAAQVLSGFGLAARQKELQAGFLPLSGGHRLGVAGIMDEQGLREITSLCVRLCHALPGVGDGVFPGIRGRHTLIIGPPGSGKTTLLRDLIRLYGESGMQVGACDERGEIAACYGGAPQLPVGPRCDVVTGMEKSRALPLLIRALAPDVLAVDEIGGARDARALADAIRCGAVLLATAHGTGPDALRRPGLQEAAGLFERIVTLDGGKSRVWTQEEGKGCWR